MRVSLAWGGHLLALALARAFVGTEAIVPQGAPLCTPPNMAICKNGILPGKTHMKASSQSTYHPGGLIRLSYNSMRCDALFCALPYHG